MGTGISICEDAQTSTCHSPEHPDLPTPASSKAIKATTGTQDGLTSRWLRGGFGQGGVQGAQPALHHAEALGEARLLPLQQLLHLPDGSQELLPAEAALRGWGGHSAGGHRSGPILPHQLGPNLLHTACSGHGGMLMQELFSIRGPLGYLILFFSPIYPDAGLFLACARSPPLRHALLHLNG